MIYTVTLNPSIDRTLSVPRLVPGAFHRTRLIAIDLDGKGNNVSRVLRNLSVESRLINVLAGSAGKALREGFTAQGFDLRFVEVSGETRQNVTLIDESAGIYTKINEPGPELKPEHLTALESLVGELAHPGDLWAFCGSLPPGAPAEFYHRLIGIVQAQGALAFLDSSEAALAAGLQAPPYAAKPNDEEAGEVLGTRVETDEQAYQAAQRLQAMGIGLVIITRGSKGLVAAQAGEMVLAEPPPVKVLSPVGAGDSTLAGALWAVSEGCDLSEMARRAVACGAATAMQAGTQVGEQPLIDQLRRLVRVTQVSR